MLTRRQWIASTGAAGAATLLGGCGDPGPLTALVLEVDDRSALVAAWALAARSFTVEIAADGGPVVATGVGSFDARGHGAVEVGALAAGRRYQAWVIADDGGRHGPMRFATAPPDAQPAAARLVVTADVDEDPAYLSDLADQVAALAADLDVSLGDWPYTDNYRASITRDDFEARYLRSWVTPRFDAWMRSTSFRAIYDDHEFGNDWDGGDRDAEPARFAAATAAWDAWFPRRGPGPRYRRWRWGALVECFLLDARAFRSANAAPDGPAKTMLGAAQRQWLTDGLRASTAPFKLVFTSVPLDFGHGVDHWAGFAWERDAILDELAAAAVTGILFVSGDQHWFAAHRHRHGFREFQIGPLSRGVIDPPPAVPGVLTRVTAYNVGVIDVDLDAGGAPRLRFRAIGAGGVTLYDEVLTPTELTPA
ncbi:MAG: alkaline phosphatase D family protein [Kofleriaceae bacterium]